MEEVTHPENAASAAAGINPFPPPPEGGEERGLADHTPTRLRTRPSGSEPQPLPPTARVFAPSPFGVGGQLAPHSEALPRFEIQVAGDQTLRRQDPAQLG